MEVDLKSVIWEIRSMVNMSALNESDLGLHRSVSDVYWGPILLMFFDQVRFIEHNLIDCDIIDRELP